MAARAVLAMGLQRDSAETSPVGGQRSASPDQDGAAVRAFRSDLKPTKLPLNRLLPRLERAWQHGHRLASGVLRPMLLSGGCGDETLRLVSPVPVNGGLRPALRHARPSRPGRA